MIGRIMPESGRVFNGEKGYRPCRCREGRTGLDTSPEPPSSGADGPADPELVLEEAPGEGIARNSKLLTSCGPSISGHPRDIAFREKRRRVEIARCLALDPSFILLDEPFSGIDPIAVADLQAIIRELKEKGYGILLTDHNVRETLSITDRAYLIHQGKVFLEGLPGDIAKNEEARKFYLGADFCW